MTQVSRGISSIQEKAKGMDKRKAVAPKDSKKKSTKFSVRKPSGPPMDPDMMGDMASRGGPPMGFKKGGSIDGCAKRGSTKGKMV